MDQREAAMLLLRRICGELDQFITTGAHAGLLGGYTGAALFYAYYFQLTGEEQHLDKAAAVVEKCLSALSDTPMDGSHCNGLSGIAWCLQHLGAIGLLDTADTADAFTEIDAGVADFMAAELEGGQNDFLHQGLGGALYFLERWPAMEAAAPLEGLIQHLEDTALTLTGGIAWKDNFSSASEANKDQDLFNLGLAHGVPAIIAVLARCYEKNIARHRVLPLLDGSISWLLQTRNLASPVGQSLFPTLVNASGDVAGAAHSRLGWCYGDLGIAATLLGAGHRLQRGDYQHEALQVFRQVARERNVKNGAVHDACMCHGSAGIAHILQQAGLYYGDEQLLSASQYWWKTTLEMNTWADGPAGFKFYHHPDFVSSHNMLEGITGIGLSLISFADTSIKPAWQESLLIF